MIRAIITRISRAADERGLDALAEALIAAHASPDLDQALSLADTINQRAAATGARQQMLGAAREQLQQQLDQIDTALRNAA